VHPHSTLSLYCYVALPQDVEFENELKVITLKGHAAQNKPIRTKINISCLSVD